MISKKAFGTWHLPQSREVLSELILRHSQGSVHSSRCYPMLFYLLHGQLHLHGRFQSRQIPSAPDLFTRPASIVGKGFHLQFQAFILGRFRILESPRFSAKGNFCLSSKLISVQLRAHTTNDWQVYHVFVYLVDFVEFSLRFVRFG